VTLKTGLGFVHGHWKWHHLIDRIRVPIRLLWKCLMLVKLEWLGYRTVKKLWRYVKPFSSDTRTLRTDGQTDRFAISITRVSVLTRDKNFVGTPKPRSPKKQHFTTGLDDAEQRALSLRQLHSLFYGYNDVQQELSYRKQIARKLRTQYVEGIHRPKYYTVTLKSRLRFTQGHWKRNHWTDHTRLTISGVIWR